MNGQTSLSQTLGTASPHNEWQTLLECASPYCDLPKVANLLKVVDWENLLGLAEEHGVESLLGSKLLKLGQLDGAAVPQEVKQFLGERKRTQNFITLRMNAELIRILEQLSSQGIEGVAIKGPVLAVRAYGDPAMRNYGDLDLLVRPRDIRRATELMSASGYKPAISLSAIDAGKIPGQYLFTQPTCKLLVELHNDQTLRYFPRRMPLEEFFARQTKVQIDAHDVPALSVEDELVLICIHGAKHFWERLMWIADVAALVSRQTGIDWEGVVHSARAVKAERMLHNGLRLASDLLKVQLSARVQADVRADGAAGQLAEQCRQWLPAAGAAPPGLFQRAFFRLRMRGGVLSAPAYLLRLSLAPTEEDWKQGETEITHKLMEVVRRPLRLVRKYGRDSRN